MSSGSTVVARAEGGDVARADGGWMMQRTRRNGADLAVHTARLSALLGDDRLFVERLDQR